MNIQKFKMKKPITCIRVFADQEQIASCRDELSFARKPIARLSKIFNLAGNEARLKILYLFYREGEMCPCDLSDVLEMTIPAISQHLRKMKDGNLITDKKVGQTIFYRIDPEHKKLLKPFFELIKSEKETVS